MGFKWLTSGEGDKQESKMEGPSAYECSNKNRNV